MTRFSRDNAGHRNVMGLIVASLVAFIYAVSPVAAQQKKSAPEIVHLGFSLNMFETADVRDANAALEIWAMEVLKNKAQKRKIRSTVYDNLAELKNAVNQGEIDIAVMSTLEYLQIKNSCLLEPGIVAGKLGSVTEEGLLITHSKSPFYSLGDLKNKTIASVNNSRGVIQRLWFTQEWFRACRNKSKTGFPEFKDKSKEEQVVYAIFFRQCDAGLISSNCLKTMIELNPQLRNDIKIVQTSPGFLYNLMCWTKSLNESEKQEMVTIIQELDEHPSGKQILGLFKTDHMIAYKPEYMQSILNLEKESNSVTGKTSIR